MKLSQAILGLALASSMSAFGAIYSGAGGSIPDANPSGWQNTITVSGEGSTLTSLSVNLITSGGYNGDLYAFLSYGNVLVPLLNRVGVGTGNAFGSSGSGFNVTFGASGTDIHTAPYVAGVTQSGTLFQADGRVISPTSAPSAFDAAGTIGLSAFYNLDPNGAWTLFVADLSGGGVASVTSWSLDITAVPEPVNVALGAFAGVLILFGLYRKFQARKATA